MSVVVVMEHRFQQYVDGTIWASSSFGHSFWERYLAVYEHIYVLARVVDVTDKPTSRVRADHPRVSFIRLPSYIGPLQFVLHRRAIRNVIQRCVLSDYTVILRAAGTLSNVAYSFLRPHGKPFGVEVVVDPVDVFAPGAVQHPLRPVFRRIFRRSLQKQCLSACAVSYVTERILQRRYPAGSDAFVTHYSSVDLGPDAYLSSPRQYESRDDRWRLITVASLEQRHKGIDIAIHSLRNLVDQEYDVELTVVGDGALRSTFSDLATSLGVRDRVSFLGRLTSGKPVRDALDAADIFVLPSKGEGLPRAMIEAMARALPCVGTTASGMPELLDSSELVTPGSADELSDLLASLLRDPERLSLLSAANHERSSQYAADILQKRRVDLYSHLQKVTREWQLRR